MVGNYPRVILPRLSHTQSSHHGTISTRMAYMLMKDFTSHEFGTHEYLLLILDWACLIQHPRQRQVPDSSMTSPTIISSTPNPVE